MKLTQVADAMSGKIAKWLKTIGRPGSREAVLVPDAGARITTVRGVYLIIALFVAIIIFFVVLIQVQMDTLTAIRAYIGGEGLWAKAQKDAVHSIEDYVMTRNEADYQAYLRLIQVPLGDRRVRIELQKENPDLAVVLAGFVQGRNNPDDLEPAVRLFRRFQHIGYMSHVIEHWTTADRMVAELNGVVEALHEEIASGRNNPEAVRSYHTRLDDVNRRVTLEEDQFSSTLAEASRWANDVVRTLTYAMALLFVVLGVGLCWPIITRIRVAENALFESESMHRLITEDTLDVLWKTDRHFYVTYISPADEYLRGFKATEVVGHSVLEMFTDEGVAIANNIIKKSKVARQSGALVGHLTFEVPFRCKDGRVLWGEVISKPELNAQGEIVGYHGITREITERKRMEEQLKVSLAEKEVLVQSLNELATHDGLTGLYNHREFYALLENELTRAQRFKRPVSLLMLDIDHFKRVNDTYGHLAGDAVLRGLSELLGREARAIDRVCRYGGEEITIILPESDLEAAANMAERMRAAVEAQPFDIKAGAPISITVSIGVVSWPAQADSAQTLVAAADAAMYAAKQGGRNRISRYEPAFGQLAAQE